MSKTETQGGARTLPPSVDEPVAIVGMSCRFPKAPNASAFWRLLCAGGDAITEVPKDRWDAAKLYDPDVFAPGKANSRWGGFLDRVDQFDPLFFGISPKEAVQLDPQQRILLELSWEALEDSGIVPDTLKESRTGVYFGLMWLDYLLLVHSRGLAALTQHTVLGSFHSFAANRVSYTLGLQGPSLVVDSASSSSLVAAHLACESLRRGETSIAIAGGMSLNLHPSSMLIMSKTGALSPDGRCYTFDARANGYVRGEGGGVVVLKLLSQAIANHDRIYCIIRGSAVNNDGPSDGFAAPNPRAQEAVLREAYARAGIHPSDVDYVELHGTGTPLGDPIEAAALGVVTGPGRPPERPLRVGSVKTNIGHLEPAAGIAGLLKTALCLKHRQLPPSLHFERINPQIPSNLPLQVQQSLTPWPELNLNQPATAGVSGFSLGGTNCHMVLQEARVQRPEQPPSQSLSRLDKPAPLPPKELNTDTDEPAGVDRPYLLPLSARSPHSLLDLAREYQRFLPGNPELGPHDIAHTASTRRSHHSHRAAFIGNTKQDWQTALAAFIHGEGPTQFAAGGAHPRAKVVFIFSGQGSQWLGMGRQLLGEEPVFHAALEECDRAIQAESGWSLLQELMAPATSSRLGRIEIIQPALVSLQLAIAALLRSWGITPDAVVGHSMGEVAAAHVCGALSLRDAIKVICRRSRLMQGLSGRGAMAMVELSSQEAYHVVKRAETRLAIAAVNGPRSTILSGDSLALDEALGQVEQQKRFFRRVHVDVASHSPQMEALRTDLLSALVNISSNAAAIPMYSTITGKAVAPGQLDAAYWYRNLREPVLFWPTVEGLLATGHTVLVELSPHPILVSGVQEGLAEAKIDGTALGTLRREHPERRCLLETLGELYVRGQDVAWAQLYPNGGKCVSLPSYPWQRERYWITDSSPQADPEVPNGESGEPTKTPLRADQDLSSFLSVKWCQLELQAIGSSAAATCGIWLVFTSEALTGTALIDTLRKAGHVCFQVVPGDSFQQLVEGCYQIRPNEPADYLAVLREAGSQNGGCQGVVHLWSLADCAAEGASAESWQSAQTLGSLSALSLVQALLNTGWRKLPRLWLVTAGTQAAVDTDKVDAVAQAPLWGLGPALALEHPELSCTTVDLSVPASPLERTALVDLLLKPGMEDKLALRGSVRYAPRLVRGSSSPEAMSEPLHAGGAYLIDDGLSGPGLTSAEWLVESGARHIVLLTNGVPSGERQRATLQRLQEAGAQVTIEHGHGAERDGLAGVLSELHQRRLPLRGVIYVAEWLGEQPLMGPEWTLFSRTLERTRQSAWNLHAWTRQEPLDFFICYSSDTLVGGAQRAGSLAASAFLDALVHYRRSRGLPGQNIRWSSFPAVQPTETPELPTNTADLGLPSMTLEECKQSFFRLLRGSQAQMTVMKLDIRQLLDARPMLADSRLWLELLRERGQPAPSAGPQVARLREALRQAKPEDRRARLEAHLSKQLGKLLRLEPERIERQTPFKKLGMDSLMSFELRNLLEATTGVQLSAVLLFTYPNLATLAGYLHDAMSLGTELEPQPAATLPARLARKADVLDQLSEDELISRLTKKLVPDKQRPK